MSDIESKLRKRVCEQLGVASDEVTRDAHFIHDLGADSLDVIEIAMLAEEDFTLEIDDDVAAELVTFGQLVDHVVAATDARKAQNARVSA